MLSVFKKGVSGLYSEYKEKEALKKLRNAIVADDENKALEIYTGNDEKSRRDSSKFLPAPSSPSSVISTSSSLTSKKEKKNEKEKYMFLLLQ